VVVGRNDDYMPDFSERLHATVAWNLRFLAEEVVFVEWNPPPERPLLSPSLARAFPAVRAYVVDPTVHREIAGTSRLPLLEYHAKNAGLRRASGDWILTTNADAFAGPDTVAKVRSRSLLAASVLVAQRVDVSWPPHRSRIPGVISLLQVRREIPDHPLGNGEFLLAPRALWLAAGGYDESSARQRIGLDHRGAAQLIAHGGRAERAGLVFHMAHATSCTEAVQEHHGEWATTDGVPYSNANSWGLHGMPETEIAERVWRIS
jgi:hypothetical protein